MAQHQPDVRSSMNRLNASRPWEPEDPAELERALERNRLFDEMARTLHDPSEYVKQARKAIREAVNKTK